MRDFAEIHERISKAFGSPAHEDGETWTDEQVVPPLRSDYRASPRAARPIYELVSGLFRRRRRGAAARLRQAVKEAEAASAAKSRQIATVVHEIRTPLNGIVGMAHLLGQTKLTAEQQNYLSGIRQSSYALMHLVDDLLDYSTLEAGRFRLNNRAENLRQLIDSVVEMLAPRAHEKRIEIAATVSAELPELLDFDLGRIRQVLFNVIGNAVKFTSEGGVLVRASLERETVCIAVSDSGPGMTAQEQARIFGEFEQMGSAQERAGGTGLGLAIASRILAEFGGSLSVTSSKGQGSTFTIRFPLWLAEDAAAGTGARNRLLSQSRVLLLAPEGPAATATVCSIETLGGRCRHVSSAAQVQMLIDRAAIGPAPYTDLIVDHRLASDYACEPSHARLHRILLVNPEERASQPQDFFDAWLIRPLREKSLIDVLSGRLRGFGTRDSAVDSGPETPSMGAAADGRSPAGLHILLGEDDPVNAMLTRTILKKGGHYVRLVDDFALLRQAAEETADPPDLILCDMHMPGGTLVEFLGWALSQKRLTEGLAVPVVVLTGDARPQVREQVLRLGASRLYQKPLDPTLLLQEVEHLCGPGANLHRVR